MRGYYIYIYWKVKKSIGEQRCSCLETCTIMICEVIYSEWGYKKLMTKNISPKILSDY